MRQNACQCCSLTVQVPAADGSTRGHHEEQQRATAILDGRLCARPPRPARAAQVTPAPLPRLPACLPAAPASAERCSAG